MWHAVQVPHGIDVPLFGCQRASACSFRLFALDIRLCMCCWASCPACCLDLPLLLLMCLHALQATWSLSFKPDGGDQDITRNKSGLHTRQLH